MSFFRRHMPTLAAAAAAAAAIIGKHQTQKAVIPSTIVKPGWVRETGRQLQEMLDVVAGGVCSHSYRNPRRATAAQIKRRARKRRNSLRHKAHVARRRK